MRLCGIGRKGYTCISSPSAVPDLTCPCFLLIISYTISSYSLMISAVAQAVIFWLTTALRIFLGIHPMGRASRSFFVDSSIHTCLFLSLLLRFVSVPCVFLIFSLHFGQYFDMAELGTYSTAHRTMFSGQRCPPLCRCDM